MRIIEIYCLVAARQNDGFYHGGELKGIYPTYHEAIGARDALFLSTHEMACVQIRMAVEHDDAVLPVWRDFETDLHCHRILKFATR